MIRILFAAADERWATWEGPLRRALAEAGVPADVATHHLPAEVDWVVYAANSPLQDFRPLTRLKGVLNLWAGVEEATANPTLTVPLARMVDDGLTEGMVEWVTAHVLRHHLGTDAHVVNPDRVWAATPPPLARQRRIGILGLGVLGTACALALGALRFDVAGWARSRKDVPGVACHHGADGLDAVLRHAQILVLLVPATPATANLLDTRTLALLPSGAVVLNPGRGELIDDDALLAALDSGHVAHATLDAFRVEPLPRADPYWHHPRVTVTPHIASATRPETAARVIAENVRRGEAGLPLLHLVDRDAGY